MRALGLIFIWLLLSGTAAEPRLITDLSKNKIEIEYRFSGTDLLLYGAIEQPDAFPRNNLDVIVTVRGPTQPVTVRKKERVLGLWLNTRSVRFQTAPSYYSVSSTRPLKTIISPKTSAVYELGIDSLHFSPAETDKAPSELLEFQQGFIQLKTKKLLFSENPYGVKLIHSVLFKAKANLPGDVPIGQYTASVFLVSKGKVIAQSTAPLSVSKSGFERQVYTFAINNSFLYGLLAVAIALFSGWLAGAVLRR